jgi:CHAD domain-containing protein
MAELKWLADVLGEVRDADVQIDRQRRDAAGVEEHEGKSIDAPKAQAPPPVPPALGPLFAELEARRDTARRALEASLASSRFEALLTALRVVVQEPPLDGPDAEAPCAEALPRLVLQAWKGLARKARDLRPRSDPTEFHRARIRAKRLRYAAEAVAPALGPEASKAAVRMAGLATEVQDLLGEHQDAVHAEAAALAAADGHPDDPALAEAAHVLARRHHRAARRARKDFPALWRRLDRKKVRRWLDPS